MGKIRQIVPTKIRKITGGKDPIRLVEELITRHGYDVQKCLQQKTNDVATWALASEDGEEEVEITLEGLSNPAETTIYIGVNIMEIPLFDCQNHLVSALTVADSLIGAKLSLVGYDLVLSVTIYTANIGAEEIDYYYELVTRQKEWVIEAIDEELA